MVIPLNSCPLVINEHEFLLYEGVVVGYISAPRKKLLAFDGARKQIAEWDFYTEDCCTFNDAGRLVYDTLNACGVIQEIKKKLALPCKVKGLNISEQ